MNKIYADQAVSISELRKSPSKIVSLSGNKPTAILNHNEPSAYLVPRELFEKMMDIIDDYTLSKKVQSRLKENNRVVKVSLSDL